MVVVSRFEGGSLITRSIAPEYATPAELANDAKRDRTRLRQAKARFRQIASGRELRDEVKLRCAEYLVF